MAEPHQLLFLSGQGYSPLAVPGRKQYQFGSFRLLPALAWPQGCHQAWRDEQSASSQAAAKPVQWTELHSVAERISVSLHPVWTIRRGLEHLPPGPKVFNNMKCYPFSITTLWQRGTLGKTVFMCKYLKTWVVWSIQSMPCHLKHSDPGNLPTSSISSQNCSGSTVLTRNLLSSDISELPLKLHVPGEQRCPVTTTRTVSCWAASLQAFP